MFSLFIVSVNQVISGTVAICKYDRIKLVFKGRGWEGMIKLDQVEGRGKTAEITGSFKLGQNCVNHRFRKNIFFLSLCEVLNGISIVFFFIYMFTSFTGHAEYFSMFFLIFTFKGPDLAENMTHLADTKKIVELFRVHGLSTPENPYTWWNQGNTNCQGEWWSGLSRESQGSRPC